MAMLAQSISCQAKILARRVLGGTALLAAMAAGAGEPSVPYVPTPQDVVEKMLEIAKVGPNDYVIDLGSGDGRIVITAAKKFGARGFGVDLNPERIRESNDNARKAGVTDRVLFQQRDLFETDLSEATVITMYLLPRVNMELRPKLLALRPGTRIVSHDFSMEDWKPDAHVTVESKEKYGGAGGKSDVYLWIVPARVAGAWRWETPVGGKTQVYEIELEQKFQAISGSARVAGRTVKLQNARVNGADIRFSFTAEVNGAPVRHELSGKVDGDTITGLARLSGARVQGQFEWHAQRIPRRDS
jgi:hypothetical protein